MEIKIKNNASYLYGSSANYNYNRHWLLILSLLEGKNLRVDTDYLFRDQFNTVGMSDQEIDDLLSEKNYVSDYIKGMLSDVRESLKLGLRIMPQSVEMVYDDARLGMAKCNYCGSQFNNELSCPKSCGDEFKEIWVLAKSQNVVLHKKGNK